MKPRTTLEMLQALTGKGVIRMTFDPNLALKCDQFDALAAKILTLPEVEALSVGQVMKVIHAMEFWLTLFASIPDADVEDEAAQP